MNSDLSSRITYGLGGLGGKPRRKPRNLEETLEVHIDIYDNIHAPRNPPRLVPGKIDVLRFLDSLPSIVQVPN